MGSRFFRAPNMQNNANEWSANQHKYQEWLATPSMERIPSTQKAFATSLGVNEATLCRWHNLEGFKAEVQAIIKANMGDVLHDVVYAFKQEAKKGSYQHQKTYFEMMGLHQDSLRQEITGKDGEPLRIEVIYADTDPNPS